MQTSWVVGLFLFSKILVPVMKKTKARYAAQGHRDNEEPQMAYDIATLCSSSIRLILSVESIKGFRIISHDVNQSYLQSKDRISRKIFILPKKEGIGILGVSEDEVLELLHYLYGFCDTDDYWRVALHFHVEDDYGMESSLGDPALHLKCKMEHGKELWVSIWMIN